MPNFDLKEYIYGTGRSRVEVSKVLCGQGVGRYLRRGD